MPDKFSFELGRQLVEVLKIAMPVAQVWVDGKISDPKTGKIMEEVGALAGIYPKVFQTRLYNDTSRRYLGPFYRYAKPVVA